MNSNSMMSPRIQKVPPVMWTHMPLDDQNFYLWYYEGKELKRAIMPNAKAAFDKVVSAAKVDPKNPGKKLRPAFASGPIPCNKGQHGIFAFNTVGRLEEYAKAKNVCNMINKAYDSLFATVQTEPKKPDATFQKIALAKNADKDDPMRIIVIVKYFGSEKKYSFRCRKWHLPGEMVCVHTCDEYKNVEVIECKTMKESEVKELAKSIGYDDISEVYCDEPIQLEEEYHEDIAELRAMRKAFAPVCDYAPANRDGYIYEEQDNYEPEDYDDLPD